LTGEDLDYFLKVFMSPTSHYALEDFYCAEEVEAGREAKKRLISRDGLYLKIFVTFRKCFSLLWLN